MLRKVVRMTAPPLVTRVDAGSSGPSGSRRPDIQGLRAVAVLMVVAFHAGLPVPGGFVGVDVFFVISGFVITAMLHREWNQNGRIRFRRFYLRRFKRLTPALALMVTVTMLISLAVLSPLGPQQEAAKTAVGAMLLVANFVIARTTGGYFDAPAETNPLLNTWSLSVEEQFYLVFPALIALGWFLARRHGWLRFSPQLLLGAIAVISFSLAIASANGLTFRGSGSILGFYSPFTRVWEFAVGALLTLALVRWTRRAPLLMTVLGTAGLLMLAASLWLITDTTPFPGPWTLLPVAGTLLLLLAGSQRDAISTRLLSTKPMVKIGDWSYSIYLWHWPLIVFAGLLWPDRPLILWSAALFSFIPALASYRWVEQPIRSFDPQTPLHWTSLVAVPMVIPMMAASLVWFVPKVDWEPTKNLGVWQSAITKQHAPSAQGCFSRGPFGADYVDACTWNRGAAGQPLYLVGDSNAWHFAEAAITAGEQLSRPVSVVTTPNCSLLGDIRLEQIGGSEFRPGSVVPGSFDHCVEYVNSTLHWLAASEPGIVFMAALDQYWWDPAIGVEVGGGQDVSGDQSKKIAQMKDSLNETVRRIQAHGHLVILVQSVPTYRNPVPIWDPRTCTYADISKSRCQREVNRTVIEQIQAPSRQAIAEVAAITGANVLDLRDYFCTIQTCSTQRNGITQYTDAVHLTPDASRVLGPEFASAVQRSQ